MPSLIRAENSNSSRSPLSAPPHLLVTRGCHGPLALASPEREAYYGVCACVPVRVLLRGDYSAERGVWSEGAEWGGGKWGPCPKRNDSLCLGGGGGIMMPSRLCLCVYPRAL